MLPYNRSLFRHILHSSVGAAWYFHIILLVVGHLVLAGISIYHQRLLFRTTSCTHNQLCLSSFGAFLVSLTTILRAIHYSVAPYAITLYKPPEYFIKILSIMDSATDSLHILISALFIILLASISSQITLNDFNSHISTKYLVLLLLTITFFIISIIFIILSHIILIIHYISLIFFTIFSLIISINSLIITYPDIPIPHCILPVNFNFYSTSSSTSSSATLQQRDDVIYYECHSGLPKSMTKTSLDEYFIPELADKTKPAIHINDLEILVEIIEPKPSLSTINESNVSNTKPPLAVQENSDSIDDDDDDDDVNENMNQSPLYHGYIADEEEVSCSIKLSNTPKLINDYTTNTVQINNNVNNNNNNNDRNFNKDALLKNGVALCYNPLKLDDKQRLRLLSIGNDYINLFKHVICISRSLTCLIILTIPCYIYQLLITLKLISSLEGGRLFKWWIWLILLTGFRLIQFLQLLFLIIFFRRVSSHITVIGEKVNYYQYKQSHPSLTANHSTRFQGQPHFKRRRLVRSTNNNTSTNSASELQTSVLNKQHLTNNNQPSIQLVEMKQLNITN